ncbi:hypothetical protein NQ318_008248 [Aromia moschata]|uniref:inositol-polyphosphate 5-phosphatase n=1 Tax=Aromia moschata TaxID=1265417 RepID=A0AAV8Y810_9CUCU|nr:hypothetical protein NQ318_008248 [Aromia moschata]
MSSTTIPVLLVTANVGSIFEDPTEMLKIWTEEFLSTVSKLDPKFIALHCQEVGGKNYELSMKHVEHFVKLLMSSNELRLFDKIRVFLDEDYSSAENFTALGNLYFVHKSLENVLLWDFKDLKFVPVESKEIYSGNIEAIVTKEKAKFPQDFFPECKWSRKGFMRTRWSLNGTVIDLVNIHLFHDASNFIAMESYPSVYCRNRRRALQHTLQRFHNDSYAKAPYFLFGDFNFRTDTDGVIKLKSFDRELEAFEETLTEYPVTFPPSYPFEEKISKATCYMQTRCPAWCDRVLLSQCAKKLVCEDSKVEYGLIGINTCMGDHKPVYLRVDLRGNAGTVVCCDHAPFACLPDKCQCCHLFASIKINIVDMSDYITNTRNSYTNIPVDSKLLHEPITRDMLSHEPYTPESVDSHSPLTETEVGDDDPRQTSVSPVQLKNRLESIIKEELKKSPRLMKRSASDNAQLICPRDTFFRTRAMSEVHKTKVRLISSDSKDSLHRLKSHHSSSDEDWFEFENESPLDRLEDCFEALIARERSRKIRRMFPHVGISETNILKSADTKVQTKVDGILEPGTVTRYICIQNIDNPIKIFRETAV